MAYKSDKTTSANTPKKAEALGFINLSMPAMARSGKPYNKKVGYIALNKGDADIEAIFEHLQANPEDAVKFVKNLIVDFRENTKATDTATVDIGSLFK